MIEYLRGLLTAFSLNVVPFLGPFAVLMILFFGAYGFAKVFLIN